MARAFIALELPKEVIEEIKKIQKLIWKKTLFTGKLTGGENLHLTLKFLGEIDDDKLNLVKKRLSEIKIENFYCEIGEVGVFSKNIIRIIWIKLNGKGIFQLQKLIDEVLSKPQTFALRGKSSSDEKLSDLFKKEERFMSHITIARVKKVGDKKGLIDYLASIKPKKLKFFVKNFVLKKSELLPEGPVYEDIEEYGLD
ncbi:MAG: RNA 2',3'-cyclic phosphodiesterase [Nanoarchaeota archaeon]